MKSNQEMLWIPAAMICFTGFIFSFIAAFPGLMMNDSFSMYNQGVQWKFNDWHHPFIGVLMAAGRLLRDDPSPYLFFQLSLLWSGIYLFTLALRNQIGNWAIIAALLGFLPLNLSLAGFLHKDPLLAACFLFSGSSLYLSYTRNKDISVVQLILLGCTIFLGSVLRGYFYLSALPILGFMLWMFLKKRENISYPFAWATTLSLLTIILFIFLNNLMVYGLLNTEKRYKYQAIYQLDMAAIYALTGKPYAVKFLRNEFKNSDSVKIYYNKEMNRSVWEIMNIYKRSKKLDDILEMKNEWIRALSENFSVYLSHKKSIILKSFGINHESIRVYVYFNPKHSKNIYKLKKLDTPFWTVFKIFTGIAGTSFFMLPWFSALLNICFSLIGLILFTIPRYRNHVLPHCVILWSGFLLLVPYALVCLSPDSRYIYWVAITSSFGGFGLTTVFIKNYFMAMDEIQLNLLDSPAIGGAGSSGSLSNNQVPIPLE